MLGKGRIRCPNCKKSVDPHCRRITGGCGWWVCMDCKLWGNNKVWLPLPQKKEPEQATE